MVDEEKYIRRMAEAIKDVPYVDHGEPPSCEDMARAAFEAVYDDLRDEIRDEAFDDAAMDERWWD